METAERLGLPGSLVFYSGKDSYLAGPPSRCSQVARAVELLGDDQRQLIALQRKARLGGLILDIMLCCPRVRGS